MISDKKTKEQHAGERKSMLLFVLLLASIACVALTVYLKSENIEFEDIKSGKLFNTLFLHKQENTQASVTFQFKYEFRENPVFCSYKGNIIQYSNKYLKAINQKGKEEWQIELQMQKPVIKSQGDYLLAADTLGRDVCLIDDNKVKWRNTVEGDIINADINSQGYVAVVHQTKNYKSAVSVYDTTGTKIFTSYIGDRYAISAKIFNSGKQVIVNSIDTSGVKAISRIDFMDMLGNVLNENYSLDSVYPQTWCFSNGSAIFLNDSSIICSDKDNQNIWKIEYGDESIYASALIKNKYLVIASAGRDDPESGSETEGIKIYGSSGKLLASYELNGAVSNISTTDDIIAVNTGAEVYFINTKGKLICTYSSNNEIIQLEMLSNDKAAIITKGNITVVEI